MRALRRDRRETEQALPRGITVLQHLLAAAEPRQGRVATPGAGSQVPICLPASSLFSAQLAAERGLPYAFATHCARRMPLQAIELHRRLLQASAQQGARRACDAW